jgi:hypothetical protein
MSILSRRNAIRLLIVGMLSILPATSEAQQRSPIVEKLAKTYGLGSFEQVEEIRYTFSAQLPGIDISRSWIWEPKSDQVTYEGKDKSGKPIKLTYLRSKLDSQSEKSSRALPIINTGCSLHFMLRGIPERQWKMPGCRNYRSVKVLPRRL